MDPFDTSVSSIYYIFFQLCQALINMYIKIIMFLSY